MSDRREAVARAIYDTEAERYDIDMDWDELADSDRDAFYRHVDAALAAIDAAEPTDVEVRAFYLVYANIPEWYRDDLSEDEKERIGIRAALGAFLAARKGGKPHDQ